MPTASHWSFIHLQSTDSTRQTTSSALAMGRDATDGAMATDDMGADDEPPSFLATKGCENLGRIQFSLKYDFKEMTLTLRVIRGVELPAKDFSGTSDPYVKIMLLPDKKHKLQTNIKRRNLNPRWNELFAFEGKAAFPTNCKRESD